MENTFHRFCLCLRTSSLICFPPLLLAHIDLNVLISQNNAKYYRNILAHFTQALNERHGAKTEQHNAPLNVHIILMYFFTKGKSQF